MLVLSREEIEWSVLSCEIRHIANALWVGKGQT